MEKVGIRELKAHLSEILRRVDERGEPVEVTREVSQHWIGEPDAVAAAREQRRNLTPDEWVPPDWRPSE